MKVPFIPPLQKCDHGSANANGVQKTLLIIKASLQSDQQQALIYKPSPHSASILANILGTHRLPIPIYTFHNSLTSEPSTSSTGGKKRMNPIPRNGAGVPTR